MQPFDSQQLESYVPVYDMAPETWEAARPFIVEQLKRLAQAINIREIGYFLDVELLSGKSFIPGVNAIADGSSSQQFRTILRKVIVFPSLTIGLNTEPHGIFIDSSFTLIQLWGSATNATILTGEPIPNGSDTISYDQNNIYITVSAVYTAGIAVIEYMQEL